MLAATTFSFARTAQPSLLTKSAIADRGRFPPINILRSVSRTMPGCNTAQENAVVDRARRLLATYEDMAELIRLGAYRRGSDPEIDEAIHHMPALEAFLHQTGEDKAELRTTYTTLAGILGIPAETDTSPDDGSEG